MQRLNRRERNFESTSTGRVWMVASAKNPHHRKSRHQPTKRVGKEIEARTGYETRVTVLGHVQRGGSPTPRDRVLATRYGLKAADLVEEGRFGRMAALRGDDIVDVALKEATAELKTVPREWFEVARAFFG